MISQKSGTRASKCGGNRRRSIRHFLPGWTGIMKTITREPKEKLEQKGEFELVNCLDD
jgi:hypothetical protein